MNFTAGTGRTATLTASSNLTLGSGSTLVISGAGLQTTAAVTAGANAFVVAGAVPAAVNGIIPGVYGTTTVGGGPTDFARYSPTAGVGFVLLAAGDYTAGVFGATNNVALSATTTIAVNSAANAIRSSANMTVNSGQVLSVGAGGILTTAAVAVSGPGTIDFGANPGLLFANSSTTTYSANLTGTAGLVRSGAGNVTLSGDLSGLTGAITNAGTATLNLNATTFAGPINILGGTVATTANIGTGGLVMLGSPTTPAGTIGQPAILNINTASLSTFARNIATVGSDGTAPFAGTAGLQIATLNTAAQLISGTLSLGTNLTINAGGTANTTLSGVISGAGGLNVLGGVVLLTNAANSFTGGLQLNGGTTAPSADAALGTGGVRFLGGTLRTDFAGSLNRGMTVLTSGTVNTNGNNVTMLGSLTGENPSAILTKTGTGTLAINASSPYPGSTARFPQPPTAVSPSAALRARSPKSPR